MTPSWMICITDGLAAYRITRLLVEDRITRGWRVKAEERYGTKGLGYVLGCYWCTGMYVGAGVVLARKTVPKAWGPLALALSYSAITGLVSEHEHA